MTMHANCWQSITFSKPQEFCIHTWKAYSKSINREEWERGREREEERDRREGEKGEREEEGMKEEGDRCIHT